MTNDASATAEPIAGMRGSASKAVRFIRTSCSRLSRASTPFFLAMIAADKGVDPRDEREDDHPPDGHFACDSSFTISVRAGSISGWSVTHWLVTSRKLVPFALFSST